MAHLRRGMFELWRTVPTLTEKCLPQSRHRNGMGLRLGTTWTLRLPHRRHATPLGQRCCTNHASALSSVSNRRMASRRVIPLPYALPGPALEAFIHLPTLRALYGITLAHGGAVVSPSQARERCISPFGSKPQLGMVDRGDVDNKGRCGHGSKGNRRNGERLNSGIGRLPCHVAPLH